MSSKQNHNLRIEMVPIDDLAPYEHNTRAHGDDDVAQIARSIERYGFNDPIGIWSDQNVIVEGHGRLMAARSLGMTEVPCVRLDHLTDDQRREYGIMHNKTAELSEWDFDALERELADLDLSEFGLSFDADEQMEDTEEELLAAVQEDEAPEPPNTDPEKGPVKQPESKRGQIWQLGEHRLMCGDSTERADVDALMGGATADAVITDPPYNVAIENAQGMTIQNDAMETEAFFEFLRAAFEQLTAHLKPGGAFYVWHASRTASIFEAALAENSLEVRQQLIW
ncbi:site-specific DNA-methyltransferase, partial [bacterium]|nr:site-specific DNA-methyltransferase [bacterium]